MERDVQTVLWWNSPWPKAYLNTQGIDAIFLVARNELQVKAEHDPC